MVAASYGGFAPTPFEEWPEDDDGHSDREEELLPSSLHDLIPDDRPRRVSRTLSGHGTPLDSKVGSPHSSSPSRYSGVFARAAMQNGLGHVGSPLRDSSFPTSHPAAGLNGANGELSPGVASPGRLNQSAMSMLTQGLGRTRIEARGGVPSGPTKNLSNGSAARASMDRNLSSTSISQRIDEEQESDTLFDMDGDSDLKTNGNSFGTIGGGRTTK